MPGLIRQALRFRVGMPSSITLGPVVTRGRVVELRPPVTGDAAEWSRLVRPERARLEPRWPESDLDWPTRTSEAAWRDRCAEFRGLVRAGAALPFLITVDGDIAGEVRLDRIDRDRGSAEVQVWISQEREGASITASALRLLLHHAFGEPSCAGSRPRSPPATAAPPPCSAARVSGVKEFFVPTAKTPITSCGHYWPRTGLKSPFRTYL